MQVIVTQSNQNHSGFAVEEVELALKGVEPSLLIVAASPVAHFKQCSELLSKIYPETHIIGCSSFGAVMNQNGLCSTEDGYSLGVWALEDCAGNYGAALCQGLNLSSDNSLSDSSLSDHLAEEVREALYRALASADRAGETPTLVWMHSAIGQEEMVLKVLADEMGGAVPVIGGGATSLLPDIPGAITCNGQCSSEGIVLAVLFPSGKVGYSFHSGSVPKKKLGIATKVEGNLLLEINRQPALQVFEDSLGARLEDKIAEERWTDIPVGRLLGEHHNLPMFTLTLPDQPLGQGIQLNTPVQDGEKLYLMQGSPGGLKDRICRVLGRARDMVTCRGEEPTPVGCLIICCSSCMAALVEELSDAEHCSQQFLGEENPFLTLFTHGEQGPLLHSQNVHGNLMIASIIFYRQDEL